MNEDEQSKAFAMLEVIEQEMIQMWMDAKEIPELLKDDEEFVQTIVSAIMLEKNYWQQHMEVGEA